MWRALLFVAGAAALAGAAIAASPPAGSPEAAGFTQLFISPCGEPYRGRPNDPYPVVLWFKQADLNHDGKIDLAEFRADHAGFFDALDANGDGVIDGNEISFYENRFLPDVYHRQLVGALDAPARLILAQGYGAYRPDVSVRPSGPGGDDGDLGQGAQGPQTGLGAQRNTKSKYIGAAAYGLLAEPEPVTAADTKLNGRITKAEFLAAADRRFKLLDRRGDGQLTLDELPQTASQGWAQHARR